MHSPVLERTDSYLHTQWRDSQTPWHLYPSNSTGFVTISRQSGSGGTSFAQALARFLNGEVPDGPLWNVFEGSLTTRMLQANHLPARFARFLPEDKLAEPSASIGELVGLHPNLWELLQKTNQTMRDFAQRGNAILVGRGANFATATIPGGVHIRLVAPVEYRARYLAQIFDVTEQQALVLNAKRDAARRRYVSATFNANVDDARAYDLVINTAQVPFPQAVSLVAALLHARQPKAEELNFRMGI